MNETYFIASAIIRVFTIIYLLIIVRGARIAYMLQNKKSEANKILILIFLFGSMGTIFQLISLIGNMYGFEAMLYKLVYTIAYSFSLCATTYSITFVYKRFPIHPKNYTMNLVYYFAGLMIGILWMSILGSEDWRDTYGPPTSLLSTMSMVITFSSIFVVIYSFKSSRRQKDLLARMSLKYYGYGSLIFTLGIVLLIGYVTISGTTIYGNIFLDNSQFILQIINAQFTYIAFFQPKWFKNKYQTTWIRDQFARFVEVNKSKK